jgi:hypothetical protein
MLKYMGFILGDFFKAESGRRGPKQEQKKCQNKRKEKRG